MAMWISYMLQVQITGHFTLDVEALHGVVVRTYDLQEFSNDICFWVIICYFYILQEHILVVVTIIIHCLL